MNKINDPAAKKKDYNYITKKTDGKKFSVTKESNYKFFKRNLNKAP